MCTHVNLPAGHRPESPARNSRGADSNHNLQPLLVDAKKAADLIQISPRLLWSLTKMQAIPARKVGRRVLYSPAELHAWVDLNCPQTPGCADKVRRHARTKMGGE